MLRLRRVNTSFLLRRCFSTVEPRDKTSETVLLSQQEVEDIKKDLPKEPYKLMEIKDEAIKKMNNQKKMLFFVNLPIVIGIPIALEGGFLDAEHKEHVDRTYIFLQMVDFFLCFNSVIMYTTLKKVVTMIEYLPAEHKLQIT